MTSNIQSSLREAADYIDRLETDRDEWKARATQYDTPERPRYVVQQVNSFGPNVGQRQTWYKIVDTAHPIGRRDFKRVGVAYDATDARHIAEMFEARST